MRGLWASLWVVLTLTTGCGGAAAANGTALFVTSNWTTNLTITQLRFSVRRGASAAVGPTTLPATASEALVSGQTVRVLLSEALGDKEVDVFVEGLFQGKVVATGQEKVVTRRGVEVPVTISIIRLDLPDAGTPDAGTPDGGTPDGGTPDGGTPDGGTCDSSNCLGCCLLGVCRNTATSPFCRGGDGGAGAVCVPCGILADNCANGGCRCGSGSMCNPGLRCKSGGCVCDAFSQCDGCCDGNICVRGAQMGPSRCGSGGQACEPCTGPCVNGICQGDGGLADRCLNCTGCCSGTQCVTAFPSCRPSGVGRACLACSSVGANTCDVQHGCSCNGGPACPPGQLCTASGCVPPGP